MSVMVSVPLAVSVTATHTCHDQATALVGRAHEEEPTEKKKKSKENRKTASDVACATMHVHVIVWF